MTTLELNKARDLKQEARRKAGQIEKLRGALKGIVPERDGQPRGNVLTSKIEELTIKIIDLDNELEELETALSAAQLEIASAISAAETTDEEFNVLYLRYVFCNNFLDIQYKLDMSDARCFYLHRQGLKKLKAKFNLK
ncbi:MAG: hypothetical protein IKT98_06485 [Selenomonadaceae bacterium]|nr:hypothetical protein [Selenomonadaceae bacterium]